MGQERSRYRKGDRENQRGIREVTEADRDREHVYHEGEGTAWEDARRVTLSWPLVATPAQGLRLNK